MKIIITFAMSHTWFFPQVALTKLLQFDPGVPDCEIVVVDNAWDWSPSIRGVADIPFFNKAVISPNARSSKWHGTALDHVIDNFDADYLFAMESDVMVLRDGWLKWYMKKIMPTDYAVGHWHGEQFINPSATLYNMKILKQASKEFRANKDPNMYWGPNFEKAESIIPHYDKFLDDVGAFSEKRGFPPGTILKGPHPTGQMRGPGWYEPAQQLHHWAVEQGYSYTALDCLHEVDQDRQIPIGTFYSEKGIEEAYVVHLWGGTRALDILKHHISDPTVVNNFEYWLEREARYWKLVVPEDVQKQTLGLIKKWGWYTKETTERDMEAVKLVEAAYRKGGIVL